VTATAPAFARLTESHARELGEGSGLTPETILASGIYSANGAEASALLGYGVGPGLVLPYDRAGENGTPTYARVKLDHAGPDGKRYRSPKGRGNRLYLPLTFTRDDAAALMNATCPLIVTEGEKKALAAWQAGLLCVAFSGVRSWRMKDADGASVTLPELDLIPWTGRRVRIVFDSDAVSNPDVRAAELALARELTTRGALVTIVRLPATGAA